MLSFDETKVVQNILHTCINCTGEIKFYQYKISQSIYSMKCKHYKRLVCGLYNYTFCIIYNFYSLRESIEVIVVEISRYMQSNKNMSAVVILT